MGRFLQFDSLTLCPIDTVPIILEKLLQEDIDWLNAYHERVFDELAPYLDDD
ncbi:MAG: M24 family metallopeptidase C-terminal domain-containing protein [Prevotella sp.]|jgi:Xaa-Pro aminopeptidase